VIKHIVLLKPEKFPEATEGRLIRQHREREQAVVDYRSE
jgi:hypothetical protein